MVAVLLCVLTGLLTMLVHPANLVGAMLFGLVPPALMVAVAVPRAGLPAFDPARPGNDNRDRIYSWDGPFQVEVIPDVF